MIDPLELNRAGKALMKPGGATTPEEAIQALQGFRFNVVVGQEILTSRNAQAALLTLVNAGARTFLGGVFVTGPVKGARMLVDVPSKFDLSETLAMYGGMQGFENEAPALVLIGTAEAPASWEGIVLRVTWQRWCSSVGHPDVNPPLAEDDEFSPAAVHAAATALSELFQLQANLNPMACRRCCSFSLYRPEFDIEDVLNLPNIEMQLLLPEKLWIIGLGHLGQAYLWNLLILPYPRTQRPMLVLQDIDVISEATISTGMLSLKNNIGEKKTRLMGEILEQNNFQVQLVERLFDGTMTLQDGEPRRALSGLDNNESRTTLENAGFLHIIDAGLGASVDQFMDYSIRTFPSTVDAKTLFTKSTSVVNAPDDQSDIADCGVIQFANIAVGAPFVGVAVATLVIAEAIRSTMNDSCYVGISGSMRTREGFRAVPKGINAPENLGFIPAQA